MTNYGKQESELNLNVSVGTGVRVNFFGAGVEPESKKLDSDHLCSECIINIRLTSYSNFATIKIGLTFNPKLYRIFCAK